MKIDMSETAARDTENVVAYIQQHNINTLKRYQTLQQPRASSAQNSMLFRRRFRSFCGSFSVVGSHPADTHDAVVYVCLSKISGIQHVHALWKHQRK